MLCLFEKQFYGLVVTILCKINSFRDFYYVSLFKFRIYTDMETIVKVNIMLSDLKHLTMEILYIQDLLHCIFFMGMDGRCP